MEISDRFRGYLPVVVDLETGGFSKEDNPILEVACSFITMRDDQLCIKNSASWSLEPFEGSHIEPASLKITGIDLDDPNRNAIDERDALIEFFKVVRDEMKFAGCHRAMGTHVSKVRSLKLDTWDAAHVALFAAMQSARVAAPAAGPRRLIRCIFSWSTLVRT